MADLQNSKKSTISWWLYLLKGALLIVLGIWMFTMPIESFTAMLLIIGLLIALSGVTEAFLALYYRKILKDWGWNFSGGILDIILGIFLIANPKAILMLITLFISFLLIVRGVLAIREALDLKKEGGKNWNWVLLMGILLLVLAIILIWHPQIVGLTMIFWMAISFFSLGIFRLILAFRLLGPPKSQ